MFFWPGRPLCDRDGPSSRRFGGLKVEDIVDDRLVVELEKEGFIKRIYR